MRQAIERACALFLVLALAIGAPAAPSRAQETDPATRARAASHFDRGIAFYNEQRYDAALAELARAYELVPAHPTLYNLARVHAALGHAVEAAQAYADYLERGGDLIRGQRRREAERALEEQRARIGRLLVRADVDGARIAIDGVDVATTPLSAPLLVSAGSHAVEVRAPGRETVRRAVAVAGQEEVLLEVALREEIVPRGTLRVRTSVPEVGIAVDGEPVGLSPLASTLALRVGEHAITAVRPGYRTESARVVIEDGAEADVRFEMRRDPSPSPEHVGRVRLELPNAPYLIRVDGEPMLGVELELPIGAHRVVLEVTDRLPYDGTLRVSTAATLTIVPPLSWTLDARRARLDAASTQRTAGGVLSILAAPLLVGGLPLLIWNEGQIARTDGRLAAVQDEYNAINGFGCSALGDSDPRCGPLKLEAEALQREQGPQNALRAVSIAATVTGTLLAVIGLPLWVSAPSSDDVDSAARARAVLRVGPGGVSLDGSF